MQIEVLDATTAAPFVIPHYHRNEFKHVEIRSTEAIFVATNGLPEVLGCVRFCVEEGLPLLRSMVVDSPVQGRGIGNKLLRSFEEYLQTKKFKILILFVVRV
ncbi:MAG: GNAT family N-acetyltransferase [Bdellovibrionales bacterium]|nr:GNAT family N-acetyltransferase [Bdellovibrionales bacterium]